MLLHVLLLVRYPLSPALRAYEFVRWFLGLVLKGLEDPAYVADLQQGGEALARLDRWLSILENLLHAIIGRLAADQLGLKFHRKRPSLGRMPRALAGRPLAFPEMFARFQRLVGMLSGVERLAMRRALRIARDLEANPLGLADHCLILRRPGGPSRRTAAAPAPAFFCARVSVHSHPSLHGIRAPP